MIYHLGTPVFFAGLLLGFLTGCLAHAGVQRWLVAAYGGPGGRWLVSPQAGLLRYVDPFGAVAAVLGGVGWPTPLEAAGSRRSDRGRIAAILVAGPLANLALGVAGYAGLSRTGSLGATSSLGDVLRGHVDLHTAGPTLLNGFAAVNLAMFVLSFVPLPPLEGARLMFLFAPPTLGWQRAEYYLIERNYGMVALLVLLVIPLGPGVPPLDYVIGQIAAPIRDGLLSAFGS